MLSWKNWHCHWHWLVLSELIDKHLVLTNFYLENWHWNCHGLVDKIDIEIAIDKQLSEIIVIDIAIENGVGRNWRIDIKFGMVCFKNCENLEKSCKNWEKLKKGTKVYSKKLQKLTESLKITNISMTIPKKTEIFQILRSW